MQLSDGRPDKRWSWYRQQQPIKNIQDRPPQTGSTRIRRTARFLLNTRGCASSRDGRRTPEIDRSLQAVLGANCLHKGRRFACIRETGSVCSRSTAITTKSPLNSAAGSARAHTLVFATRATAACTAKFCLGASHEAPTFRMPNLPATSQPSPRGEHEHPGHSSDHRA